VSRYGRIRILLATAIVLIAAAVWGVGRIQASADDSSTRAIAAGQGMLIGMLDQETGLRGFINTHAPEFLEPYRRGRESFDLELAIARRDSTDKQDVRSVTIQTNIARRWQGLAELELTQVERGRGATIPDARRRKVIMDQFRKANADFVADKQHDRTHDRSVAQMISVAIILGLGVVFGVLGWLTFERPVRRETDRRRRLAEFSDALQVARSEREAFAVLRRHLEGWFERARAVVLIRNASANRLQAATGLEHTPVLAKRLVGAAPEACLAVRLAKPYLRKPGTQNLLQCELCAELPECSACAPTIVGGEVIGSVIVQTPKLLEAEKQADLAASVAAGGPVIANLRNLAIAETRASTDALTGLANHRAVQDTLNRMVAQASRTKTQLACILFDLDHFKQVNDVYGHAKGDEVLASVGAAIAASVRDSDFVGRYGGEEFVALLPDTETTGARVLAEKLRVAIADLTIADIDHGISGSFGIAVLPGNAATGEHLLRAADRALYAAKNAGRNRVEVFESDELRGEPAERR
jgi:diguanylate cyclase (GGDEF)-like protein